ncbi:MAG: hypothetical protein NTX25_20165, partial [Proteobacteria bacterium]|nr:hypothetical protein [Pseudomonadota bacterium]
EQIRRDLAFIQNELHEYNLAPSVSEFRLNNLISETLRIDTYLSQDDIKSQTSTIWSTIAMVRISILQEWWKVKKSPEIPVVIKDYTGACISKTESLIQATSNAVSGRYILGSSGSGGLQLWWVLKDGQRFSDPRNTLQDSYSNALQLRDLFVKEDLESGEGNKLLAPLFTQINAMRRVLSEVDANTIRLIAAKS